MWPIKLRRPCNPRRGLLNIVESVKAHGRAIRLTWFRSVGYGGAYAWVKECERDCWRIGCLDGSRLFAASTSLLFAHSLLLMQEKEWD